MKDLFRANEKKMGATGAGLSNEHEINPANDKLLGSWRKFLCILLQVAWEELIQDSVEEVKQKCPWFYTMKDLLPEKDNPLEGFQADGTTRPRTDIINDCKCTPLFRLYVWVLMSICSYTSSSSPRAYRPGGQ